MSEDQKIEVAKKYVDKQLETMRRYGSAPKDMSEEEYRGIVLQVAEAVKS
jgi:hypothetical protein